MVHWHHKIIFYYFFLKWRQHFQFLGAFAVSLAKMLQRWSLWKITFQNKKLNHYSFQGKRLLDTNPLGLLSWVHSVRQRWHLVCISQWAPLRELKQGLLGCLDTELCPIWWYSRQHCNPKTNFKLCSMSWYAVLKVQCVILGLIYELFFWVKY